MAKIVVQEALSIFNELSEDHLYVASPHTLAKSCRGGESHPPGSTVARGDHHLKQGNRRKQLANRPLRKPHSA